VEGDLTGSRSAVMAVACSAPASCTCLV